MYGPECTGAVCALFYACTHDPYTQKNSSTHGYICTYTRALPRIYYPGHCMPFATPRSLPHTSDAMPLAELRSACINIDNGRDDVAWSKTGHARFLGCVCARAFVSCACKSHSFLWQRAEYPCTRVHRITTPDAHTHADFKLTRFGSAPKIAKVAIVPRVPIQLRQFP